jgi:glutamate dehydrogenase (NADP+)
MFPLVILALEEGKLGTCSERTRSTATGFGLVYYVSHMIKYASNGAESFKNKTVAISGSGNVAQFAALKVIELGGHVISLSDSKGALIAKDHKAGVTKELIEEIADLKLKRKALADLQSAEGNLAEKFNYIPGARPWTQFTSLDIALPCATQNEVSGEEAAALIKAGVKFVAEGSNMGCTKDAIDVFEQSRMAATTTTKGRLS